jgi:DNA-binding NarL/FixJ family response regulator
VIRIAVADDHPLFREGLRKALSVGTDLVLVGEASDGQAALELCGREQPDLLILDLTMPRCDGFGVLEQLHRVSPDTRALVLTVHLERRYEEESIAAGAGGFLQKDAPVSTILKAVRAVASGQSWASRRSASLVLQNSDTAGPREVLTSREREVLALLGQGLKNQEIAAKINLSQKTVATHIGSLIAKLGVRSRVEAALLASRYSASGETSAAPGRDRRRS